MQKLSAKKKVATVKQYLSGLSYDEIAAKSGVSKGTVSNVVADLKAGRFPEAADVVDHIAINQFPHYSHAPLGVYSLPCSLCSLPF